MTTIAWVGLGRMGMPMSRHLVEAGHQVQGYDLNPAAVLAGREQGLEPCSSVAEAVEGAEFVLTMLPHGSDVLQVYSAPGGVLDSASDRAVLLDCSTVSIAACEELHRLCGDRGLAFLDAPVSGGTVGAEAGSLTFMVGGDSDVFHAASEVITPMSANIFHTGGPTTGQVAKICNNLILLINLASTAEGATLAKKLGLDPRVFYDIASVSSADSWPLRNWYPIPGVVAGSASSRGFEPPTFTARLAHKDLGLALEAARAFPQALPLGTVVFEAFQELMDTGHGGKDCSIISTLL